MHQTEQLTTEAMAERYGAAWAANDLEAIMALQGDDMVFEVVEPSGRRAEVDGVDVITVRDGLVRSKHTYMDTLALRRQLAAP